MTDAADPKHQDFERQWWGTCVQTFSEENKQIVYMSLMGVIQVSLGEVWPTYLGAGRSIVDIGGGPVSPLLKTVNLRRGAVVDPCQYPDWTMARYEHVGINVYRQHAEDWLAAQEPDSWDEAWCMNVLQHVVDPRRIVTGMRQVAKTVRIFEWIDTGPSLGHPHSLTEADLNQWLGGQGKVTELNGNGCVGRSYSGVFS